MRDDGQARALPRRRRRTEKRAKYDKSKSTVSFIVAGSARLDYYRRGGDSLQGRYHYYLLHLIYRYGIRTVSGQHKAAPTIRRLYRTVFNGDERFHRRWLREYSERIFYSDLRDLENVREVSLLELLLSHLPARGANASLHLVLYAFTE